MTTQDKAKQALSKENGEIKSKSLIPTTFAGMKSGQILDILDNYRMQVSSVLPEHITPARIFQIITTVVTKTPNIAKCTVPSVIGAMIQAAIFGFDPTPELGYCFFVPYRNKQGLYEAQFQIGYRGYIQLAYRNPTVKEVYAYAVKEKDEFSYQLGLHRDIKHIPKLNDPGILVASYAVLQTTNGGLLMDVADRSFVMAAKSRSKAAGTGNSPWDIKAFEPEMWCKVALKKLLKKSPLSIEDMRDFETDEAIITPEYLLPQGKGADINQLVYPDEKNGFDGNGQDDSYVAQTDKSKTKVLSMLPNPKEDFVQQWLEQDDNEIQKKFNELSGKIPNFKWESVVKAVNLPLNTPFENLKKSSRVDVLWYLKDFVKNGK